MSPRPGEIYWASADDSERDPTDDSERHPGNDPKRHPVVVVSREKLNRGDYVTAVEFTSKRLELRWDLPNCVPFRAGQFGLTKNCVARAETIGDVFRSDLDEVNGPIGTLNDQAMRDLVKAIGFVISSDCEPV